MSLLFDRRHDTHSTVRAGQPAFTFSDWVRVAGGVRTISASSLQCFIEQALTSSVVWRCDEERRHDLDVPWTA